MLLYHNCVIQGAFHDNPVGTDRGDEIIHSGQGMNQILVIDRTGKVEEHIIEITLRQEVVGIGQRLFRVAFHDRIGFLLKPGELFVS